MGPLFFLGNLQLYISIKFIESPEKTQKQLNVKRWNSDQHKVDESDMQSSFLVDRSHDWIEIKVLNPKFWGGRSHDFRVL